MAHTHMYTSIDSNSHLLHTMITNRIFITLFVKHFIVNPLTFLLNQLFFSPLVQYSIRPSKNNGGVIQAVNKTRFSNTDVSIPYSIYHNEQAIRNVINRAAASLKTPCSADASHSGCSLLGEYAQQTATIVQCICNSLCHTSVDNTCRSKSSPLTHLLEYLITHNKRGWDDNARAKTQASSTQQH